MLTSYRQLLLALSVLELVFIGFTPNATAQASRTWVSGVGDDAALCSRTAPGKTFVGAISKTAVGGIISVLDPGGFGGVTITKSITIDGSGTMAHILVSGTNGVVINAPGGRVVLRELILDGFSTGLNGVRIINAAVVHLDRCTISNFQNGIKIEGAGQVFLKDCVIRNCSITGIDNSPAATSLTDIQQTRIEACESGIVANGNVRLTGARVSVVGSTNAAVALLAGGTATFTESTFANNGAGLYSEGKMFVGTSLITNNVGQGLQAVKPGSIRSLKGNQLIGNSPDGKFTNSIPQR